MITDELIELIKNAYSINDCSLKIYGYSNGRCNEKIKKIIRKCDIDVSHFKEKNKNRKYEIITKECSICFNSFETQKGHKKEKITCSTSCYNKYKGGLSDETKDKISKSLIYKNRTEFKKTCVLCDEEFIRWRTKCGKLSKSKTCSIKCAKELKSLNTKIMVQKRVKEGKHKGWISRNVRSYPEKFFDEVLKNNNLFDKCEINYKILKKDLDLDCHSCYFLDYYFGEKEICLEIDGQQHELEERKISDNIRDEALINNGIKVYRIKWKSINNENGKKYIKNEIDNFLKYYNKN